MIVTTVFIILLLPLFAIDLMGVLFHPDVLGPYLRFIFLFAL